MKIWIDFINTPQVSFAVPFIKELEEGGHTFILTCRDSGNTVGLLEQHKLKYTVIGKLAGSSTIKKIVYFPLRILSLLRFILKEKPDVAFGQSSFYLPVVSFLSGIRSIYTNDNEHAKANLFGFYFASNVVLPSVLSENPKTRKWPLKNKLQFYPGLKEAIYLSQTNIGSYFNTTSERSVIYFRPEPWSAQYYKGPQNFFDDILSKLSMEYSVMVLPRDRNQIEYYQSSKFNRLTVAEKPIRFEEIARNCLLFIGAGGSMTRELAILGIPVISIYQADLLKVDEYLRDHHLLYVNPNITIEEIKNIVRKSETNSDNKKLIEQGNESYLFLKQMIEGK